MIIISYISPPLGNFIDYARIKNAPNCSDDDGDDAPHETVTPIIDSKTPGAPVSFLNQRIDYELRTDLSCDPLKPRTYAKHLHHPYNNTITSTSTEVTIFLLYFFICKLYNIDYQQ